MLFGRAASRAALLLLGHLANDLVRLLTNLQICEPDRLVLNLEVLANIVALVQMDKFGLHLRPHGSKRRQHRAHDQLALRVLGVLLGNRGVELRL